MVETGANVRHVCYGFGMTLSQGYMRFPFALGLVVALLGPPVSEAADRKQASDPWIASVRLIRDGALDGSGIYLKSGLVITAAHLTAAEAKMGVQIAGVALPATVLKQGSFEDVDLTLLSIDEEELTNDSVDRDVIADFISDMTHYDAGPENIARVAARLAAAGWPLFGISDHGDDADTTAASRANSQS